MRCTTYSLPSYGWTGLASPTIGTTAARTATSGTINNYRVWFADRSCVTVDAANEDEARSTATAIAIRNGNAPHHHGSRIASVEAL